MKDDNNDLKKETRRNLLQSVMDIESCSRNIYQNNPKEILIHYEIAERAIWKLLLSGLNHGMGNSLINRVEMRLDKLEQIQDAIDRHPDSREMITKKMEDLDPMILDDKLMGIIEEDNRKLHETPYFALGNYLEWNSGGKTFPQQLKIWKRTNGEAIFDVFFGVLNCGPCERTIDRNELIKGLSKYDFKIIDVITAYGWSRLPGDNQCVVDQYGIRAEIRNVSKYLFDSLCEESIHILGEGSNLRSFRLNQSLLIKKNKQTSKQVKIIKEHAQDPFPHVQVSIIGIGSHSNTDSISKALKVIEVNSNVLIDLRKYNEDNKGLGIIDFIKDISKKNLKIAVVVNNSSTILESVLKNMFSDKNADPTRDQIYVSYDRESGIDFLVN